MQFLLMTIHESNYCAYNFLRKTVIQHCLNLCAENVFNKQEVAEIKYMCRRLDTMTNWEKIARKNTRTRFVYWIRTLNNFILEMIMSDIKRPNQLNYFLMALNDPIEMLWNVKHLEKPNIAVDNYKREVYRAFTDRIIKPICRKVEEEIRL